MEGIKTLRRENNKFVEEGIKTLRKGIKLKRERGKYNIVRSIKKKGWLAFFDYFNRIFNLIEGHKVEYLCLKKRVWFYC